MEGNNRTKKDIHTAGRRGTVAHIEVYEYENGSITACAEQDKITRAMLRNALNRHYPRHTFYASFQNGLIYAQADPVMDGAL